MWIFGYGSLIWKIDFPYETKLSGYIEGYDRKFYQHSTDHRGTPEKPGRVVTLIPNPKGRVYGVAFKIAENEKEKVLNHLDYREKGGYVRQNVKFYPQQENKSPFEISVYIATVDNFQYAGPADDDTIAHQIAESIGPSGPNIEYLKNLASATREMFPGVIDEHLFTLEKKVLDIIKNKA